MKPSTHSLVIYKYGVFLLLLSLITPFILFAQPGNNSSCSATSLTSAMACTTTAGTLRNAGGGATAFAGVNALCGDAASPDVWYSFQAQSTNPTISLSAMANQMRLTPRLALYNLNAGACNSLSNINGGAITCVSGTNTATLALAATGLTIGTTYSIRVFTNGTSVAAGVAADWNFNICVTDPPLGNDNCTGAAPITSTVVCGGISGTLLNMLPTAGVPGSCGSALSPDAWFTFIAQTPNPTIRLNNVGSNLTTAGPLVQVLSGGTCATLGSATSLGCGSSPTTLAGLTVGNTYRLRVTTTSGTAAGATTGNWGFSLCVQDPPFADIDYGKSYINITKGTTGGTVSPGDILEIRSTLVIRENEGFKTAIDNVSFFDTLKRNLGFALVSGTIALRTNEGFIFGSAFGDAVGDGDAGMRSQIAGPLDTAIRINLGTGATSAAGGKLGSYSKPSFYGFSCIVMATYRVQVYAGYGSKINFGGGAFTYRDSVTSLTSTIAFPRDSLVLYNNPGLCTDAVSVLNAVGAETNGTFGIPAGGAPLARNRGTSTSVPGYSYVPFNNDGGPDDYHYGIANNTSAIYTTLNTHPKPDAGDRRFTTLWDITGDHTGASNLAQGNPPCDTTLPRSASNPCGYMLVINSSYKTDYAFNYSVTNLCPNTYYEVSAWIKNMCSLCGCDIDGDGAGNAPSSYNPNVIGDSSGVKPNLAFKINGIDYYTTGNIAYTGSGSDANNIWVKKGFTYLTGPSEVGFNLTIRNNAPGGGGNDWALDDIGVLTCIPTMKYSPSITPTICAGAYLTIRDTVRSFFSNYINYRWQRSTNGGVNWSDIGSASSGSATLVSGKWQYVANYTIPPAFSNVSNNGNRYRVIVATTPGNLTAADCQTTDGTSIITLNVIDCGVPLKTNLISFNGNLIDKQANLTWSAANEDPDVKYIIERSADGNLFSEAGNVYGNNNGKPSNEYSFIDPVIVTGKAYYRLSIVNTANNKKYSRIINLSQRPELSFDVSHIVNPFNQTLDFDITVPLSSKVDIELLDMFGKIVKRKSLPVQAGINTVSIMETASLSAGAYILRIKNNAQVITKKVLKKNNL